MRLYRVSMKDPVEGHQGYQYAANKRQATRLLKLAKDNGNTDSEVDAILVTPTKAGIVAALDRFGGHPDNG